MIAEDETPEEAGRRAAERTLRELKESMPAIQMAAAVFACLHQLIALLIVKGVIEPQEALDAFARASDDVQCQPDDEVAVQVIEVLCRKLAKRPGAKRPGG